MHSICETELETPNFSWATPLAFSWQWFNHTTTSHRGMGSENNFIDMHVLQENMALVIRAAGVVEHTARAIRVQKPFENAGELREAADREQRVAVVGRFRGDRIFRIITVYDPDAER